MLFTSKDFHILSNFMFWAGNDELYSLMNRLCNGWICKHREVCNAITMLATLGSPATRQIQEITILAVVFCEHKTYVMS